MWNIPCLSDLKKAILFKKYQGPQFPFWNIKLLPTTQGLHSRRWLRPFHTFYEDQFLQFSMCTLLWTLSKQTIQKTLRKRDFPPSSWASMVLLHTNSILPVSSPHVPLYVHKIWGFFAFLTTQENGALFIRLWSMKNYLFRAERSQMWEGPSNFLRSFPNWLTTRILTREAFLEQPRATMAWTSSLVFLTHFQYWSPVLNYHD